MIKLSDALKEIIEKNPILKFSMYNGLFNLTKFAKFVKPLVEARTKKEVQVTAITMTLSRLQRELAQNAVDIKGIKLENVAIYSNLQTLTYFKTNVIHEKIMNLHSEVQKRGDYITITEGMSEITLIIKNSSRDLIDKSLSENPKNIQTDLNAIGINFAKEYTHYQGLIHMILQQLSLQGIDIVEIASTYTELFIYINKDDSSIAFDTIINSFIE